MNNKKSPRQKCSGDFLNYLKVSFLESAPEKLSFLQFRYFQSWFNCSLTHQNLPQKQSFFRDATVGYRESGFFNHVIDWLNCYDKQFFSEWQSMAQDFLLFIRCSMRIEVVRHIYNRDVVF